jgi:hypothetical protein
MTLQNLHDLTRLQIPNIRFVILTSRHDPFSAGNAKACRDAILGVDMADVRFQTSSGLIIPQTDSIVVGRREDVL